MSRCFWSILTPSLPCHTSRGPLLKYVTHLGPPIFISTKKLDKNSLYKISQLFAGVLSGRFCPGWNFVSLGSSIKYVTFEGEGVRDGVTVCDSGAWSRAFDVTLIKFFIIHMKHE